jgi:hypothetical protein
VGTVASFAAVEIKKIPSFARNQSACPIASNLPLYRLRHPCFRYSYKRKEFERQLLREMKQAVYVLYIRSRFFLNKEIHVTELTETLTLCQQF